MPSRGQVIWQYSGALTIDRYSKFSIFESVDKPLRWMGQTKKDLRAMPQDVKDEIGHALRIAQQGGKSDYAHRMKGNLRPVTEIIVDEDSDTYRAMYTTELPEVTNFGPRRLCRGQ